MFFEIRYSFDLYRLSKDSDELVNPGNHASRQRDIENSRMQDSRAFSTQMQRQRMKLAMFIIGQKKSLYIEMVK